jgi:hypothetical protein
MDDERALKRLRSLLQEEGALQIITPFHACTDGNVTDLQMASASASDRKACTAYAKEHNHVQGIGNGYRSVGHYRLVPVARLEEAEGSQSGRWTAYGGDPGNTRVTGTPRALLARLTEHEQG